MSWGEGKPKVALLWDESFLWGVVSHKALKGAGLPFRLIRADDVRAGVLAECAALFVPGGWASNKIKALGEKGVSAVRQFVKDGGTYIGFCGGERDWPQAMGWDFSMQGESQPVNGCRAMAGEFSSGCGMIPFGKASMTLFFMPGGHRSLQWGKACRCSPPTARPWPMPSVPT